MTAEKPELRIDVELGHDLALAELAGVGVDPRYAVDHQHIAHGQLRVAGAEHFAVPAGEQLIPVEGVLDRGRSPYGGNVQPGMLRKGDVRGF